MNPLAKLVDETVFSLDDAVFAFLKHCDLVKRLRSATLKAYRFDLQQFEAWCILGSGKCSVGDVVAVKVIHAYLSDRKVSRMKSASRIARIISTLKSFFGFMLASGFIDSNPMVSVSKPVIRSKVPRFCKVDECRSLLSHGLRPRTRAIISLLLYTGLRVSEIASIKRSDVDFKRRRLLVHGKGGKERVVPFSTSLVAHLKPYSESGLSTVYLFPGRAEGLPLSVRTVQRIVGKTAVRVGISGKVSPHTLRHSYATGLIDADNGVPEVQRLLGHSSIRTTQIYLHVSGKRLKKAAESLDFG